MFYLKNVYNWAGCEPGTSRLPVEQAVFQAVIGESKWSTLLLLLEWVWIASVLLSICSGMAYGSTCGEIDVDVFGNDDLRCTGGRFDQKITRQMLGKISKLFINTCFKKILNEVSPVGLSYLVFTLIY